MARKVKGQTTIQIVDVSGERPVHVRKVTVSKQAAVVLGQILDLFEGHLVTAKRSTGNARDRGQNQA